MNLFYNFNESNVVENVKMKWPSDEYVIPQGTPMSRTGIANNGDAIGILARDAVVKFPYPLSVAKLIGKKEPKGNEDYTFAIITSGFLNLSEVEKAFGDKISDEAKKAMANINFVDDKAPNSFGGSGGGASGGGLLMINATDGTGTFKDIMDDVYNVLNTDVPYEKVVEALKNGRMVIVNYLDEYNSHYFTPLNFFQNNYGTLRNITFYDLNYTMKYSTDGKLGYKPNAE